MMIAKKPPQVWKVITSLHSNVPTEFVTIAVLRNITSTPDKIPHEKPFEIPYDAPQEMAMGKSATHRVWYKRSAARRYRQGADVKIEMEQVF
jgi:hypothetical protein